MTEEKKGCVAPATGPIVNDDDQAPLAAEIQQEAPKMLARVGHPAPDFEVPAFIPEKNDFANVKLSDYKGKWITLCFYPGDFTFV